MSRAPSPAAIRAVVVLTAAVSLLHFTDNAVNIDTYPKAGWQPEWFGVVVAGAWFLYTAVGIAGYRLYGRGNMRGAHIALIAYGALVISSLGHFLLGSPADLTTRAVISVFVDAAAGSIVIAIALWSILARAGDERQPAAG